MHHGPVFLIVGALLVLAALAPEPARAEEPCRQARALPVDASAEQRLAELINAERAKASLPPLKIALPLTAAARDHAADMVRDRYFSHESQDRSPAGLTVTCGWDRRIRSYYAGAVVAETIALGHTAPADAVRGWMASPAHRDIILSREHRELGAGLAADPAYGTAWVLTFGRRDSVFPLVIAGEAAETGERAVRVAIHDDSPGWREVRVRVDRGAWGAWQPFRPELTLDLGPTRGTRLVTAQVRRPGRTVLTSDTIIVR